MQVLLPPSEAKASDGLGSPLNLLALHLPELRPHRAKLVTAVQELCQDVAQARAVLKVSSARDADIQANALLHLSPTMPALHRYTGVLYAGLDVASMTPAEQARAHERTTIMSALFGPISGGDLIPAYRLSAASRLPHLGVVSTYWRSVLPAVGHLGAPVLDLRSAAYQAFAPAASAITVRVVTERPDGSRTVVSHFNKHAKGLLTRAVVTPRREIDSVDEVIHAARTVGLYAEQTGEHTIDIVT